MNGIGGLMDSWIDTSVQILKNEILVKRVNNNFREVPLYPDFKQG